MIGNATLRTPAARWSTAIVALSLLILAAYWPGLWGGFVFDDFPNIVDNAVVHVTTLDARAWVAAAFSSEAGTLQRPISMLSFAINHYFTGLDSAAMKGTNLAIHALNAVLVLGLVRLLLALVVPQLDRTRRMWAAVFVAAAWALNPINLLAVLYVVQRMESLSHVFVFGGLWLYLFGRQRQLAGGSGRWPIGLGLMGGTALGMLCKESAVLLPVYAWLLEACVPALRTSPQKGDVRKLFLAVLWLPLLAGIAWLAPRVTAPAAFSTRDFNLVERLLTEGRVVLDYLRWTVFPPLRELTLYHDDYVVSRGWLSPPSTLFAMIGIAAIAVVAWWLRARRPLTALGLLWFLAAQALTATVIPLELVYEHRNYFASLGVCLVLADWLLIAPVRASTLRIGGLLAACFVLAFGATTHLRAREWADPMRFAASEAAKRPQSPRATYGYGRMLVIATDYRADSPQIGPAVDALERARALPRSGILPHSALLLLAAHTKIPQQTAWWRDMQDRLRRDPVGPQEVNALASLVRCARSRECDFPVQQMVASLEAALARPNADIFNIYADYALNVLRDPDKSVLLFRKAIAMKPRTAQYRINLAKVLIAIGRRDEATREIAALRELGRFGEYESAARELEGRMGPR
jgi:tetratricopeptide (TPR) repeat protein